jgi:SsrA-binding protein
MTAGIELFGFEVKSLRNSQGSLDGAYVIIRGGEAYLIGAYIPHIQPANTQGGASGYDERRNRKLILHRSEIVELADTEGKKGSAIIPLSIFQGGRKIKVEIGIGEGKKKHDKRETLKKRETDREIRRKLKR